MNIEFELQRDLADERSKNYELRRQLTDAEDEIRLLKSKLELLIMSSEVKDKK